MTTLDNSGTPAAPAPCPPDDASPTTSPARLKAASRDAEAHRMVSGNASTADAAATASMPSASPASPAPQAAPDAPATYRQLFGIREFRALFTVDLVSLLGDQVAAVAVAVLLYQNTGSALLSALGYATSFLPWFIGGPILGTWAERMRPRTLMIGCDLARAALIGLAALPGVPMHALWLLVFLSAMLTPPFDAVASAVTVDALPDDVYTVGISVRSSVHQVAQLVGFAFGGLLVDLVGTRPALALDAASFLASAALLRIGLRARPAPVDVDGPFRPVALLRDTLLGVRAVAGDTRLRTPLLLSVLIASCVVVPEAIATAYVDELGGRTRDVGLIMASTAAGAALGAFVIGRFVAPRVRLRLLAPLSVASGLPLLITVVAPPLPVCLVLFALAGACSSITIVASTLFGRAAAPHLRARAFAVAMACLYGGQTLAIVLGGLAATLTAPHLVVAGAGVIGVLAALALVPHTRRLTAGAPVAA